MRGYSHAKVVLPEPTLSQSRRVHTTHQKSTYELGFNATRYSPMRGPRISPNSCIHASFRLVSSSQREWVRSIKLR